MSNMKKHDENKFYQEYICRAVIEKIKPDLNFVKFESLDFFDTKKEIGMEVTIAEVANSYSNSMKYAKLKSGRFRDCEKATRELLKNGKMTKAGYKKCSVVAMPTGIYRYDRFNRSIVPAEKNPA